MTVIRQRRLRLVGGASAPERGVPQQRHLRARERGPGAACPRRWRARQHRPCACWEALDALAQPLLEGVQVLRQRRRVQMLQRRHLQLAAEVTGELGYNE